ncbi:MAG: metallophosphoesterase [Sandaracinaceae bacterium]|nr:metallophosphoesterase [Sandaracinaceae bacterium]
MNQVLRLLNATPFEVRRFQGPPQHREQLSRLKVVHLTDLHFGRVTPIEVQREAVEIANGEKPDLVVITGDFVCHSHRYLDALIAELSRLNAPTIGVLGNHDYWSGEKEVIWALKKAGVEVLRNQWTEMRVRGEKVQVVGLDDAYTGHGDVEQAVKGLRKHIASIGLSHIAEEADALWEKGVPLVLSGHTHGGQITVARLNEIALGRIFGHRYIHGLYGSGANARRSKGSVYVNAGVGAAIIPLRIGEKGRREVVVFELGAEPTVIHKHHGEQEAYPTRLHHNRYLRYRPIRISKKRA